MNYKNILFDLGGVLIDLSVRRSLAAFAALINVPKKMDGAPSSVSELVTADGLLGGHTSQLIDQYQIGAVTTDQFIAAILAHCKPGTTRQQVIDAWYAMLLGIRDEKKALLRQLILQGKHIYVLSNINDLHVTWTLTHCPELKQADRLFFSNEIGMSKPDPRCYELVINETKIKPEETVYVDDLLPNIEAGRPFGFQCLHAVGNDWMKELVK
ncbi:MAG: HAD family phosphatase [Paludibacteraceae bacterium]|nr:HAD family phosphatase [Paludibacteraceae bacterium]